MYADGEIKWDDNKLAKSFTGEILWDGRFPDGTVAPAGDYRVTVKAHDQAGNESEETAVITVENSLFTYLIPRSAPPAPVALAPLAEPALPAIPPALPSTDPNGEDTISNILAVAPPDVAQRITDHLGDLFTP